MKLLVFFGVVGAAAMFPTGKFDQSSFACDWITDFVNCLLLAGKSACPEVAPIASAPQITIQPGVNFLGKWRQWWTATPQASGVGTPTERGLLQAEAALATPSVCALARSGAFSELEFEYGCVTVPPLPPR